MEEGDFFGFFGPNGAGKSTTIRTLPGLVIPTAGEARVPGHVVRDRLPILREVGYLPSKTAFSPGMGVREVPALSAGLRGVDCRDEVARERIKKKKPR